MRESGEAFVPLAGCSRYNDSVSSIRIAAGSPPQPTLSRAYQRCPFQIIGRGRFDRFLYALCAVFLEAYQQFGLGGNESGSLAGVRWGAR